MNTIVKINHEKKSNLTPIMSQYLDIKNKYKDHLVFFRLGDFYELFYEDAVVASNELDIVLTAREKNKDGGVPMCGVPYHASRSYISKLIKAGHRIAICEQMETPETKTTQGPLRREVVSIITPGTVIDEDLLSTKDYNFLMAVYTKDNKDYSIAFIDVSTGDFFVESILECDLLMKIETFKPSEILIQDKSDVDLIKKLEDYKEIIHFTPNMPLLKNSIKQKIADFYQIKSLDSINAFSPTEINSICMVLEYLKSIYLNDLPYISHPLKIQNDEFLRVDDFTQRSLEILTSQSKVEKSSLYDALNYTLTSMGSRLLKMRLANPLKNIDLIKRRQKSIETFLEQPSYIESTRLKLKKMPDIARVINRINLHAKPRDLKSLYYAFNKIRDLKNELFLFLSNGEVDLDVKEIETESQELKNALIDLKDYSEYIQIIENSINIDSDYIPINIKEGGFIKTGYCEILDRMRYEKECFLKSIESMKERYNKLCNINIKVHENQILGYYIEISKSNQNQVPYTFIHKQTLKNTARYTTKELSDLEIKIEKINSLILKRETDLFNDVILKIINIKDNILKTSRSIGIIDVSSALSLLAFQHDYTKPIIDESKAFSIEEGRHPVLDQKEKNFITNNCELKNKTWILTGPNMAGKSTYLRQNALIAVMAQVGSYVPAQKAHIGIIDKIFARIGASDDLARGRSTFMVEMIETASILNNASSKSFIILDEIGRGTSTYDGIAIAWSAVEHINKIIKARCIFATHYHELVKIKEVDLYTTLIKHEKGVLKFLYKIMPGYTDKSYGIDAAELAGLPKSIVKNAKKLIKEIAG